MANAQRYRYQSTDHFRETTDIRHQQVWNIESGQTYINRVREFPSEQWYYSPDRFSIDTVGFRDRDNPLYLSHEISTPPVIRYFAEHEWDLEIAGVPNGERQRFSRNFEGWGSAGHALALDEPDESDVEFVTRAVAGLNPSRSNFQATVFLAELRDLPSLLKNVGEELAQQGVLRGSAGQYLKGQYGFRPLVNDLKTFFNVAGKIRNRMKTLKELRGKGKIRRQFKEPADQIVKSKQRTMMLGGEHSVGVHPYNEDIIDFEASTTMQTSRWADVEFVLDTPDNLFAPIDDELWDEAHSLVYGTTIDGPALWAAMPWSWLIDWSTNMSDYIKSQNNVVGAKFSKAVLMKTTRRATVIKPIWRNAPDFNGQFYYTFSEGSVVTTTKERILNIEPAAVSTTEAILSDGFRASILSALTVQRFRIRT